MGARKKLAKETSNTQQTQTISAVAGATLQNSEKGTQSSFRAVSSGRASSASEKSGSMSLEVEDETFRRTEKSVQCDIPSSTVEESDATLCGGETRDGNLAIDIGKCEESLVAQVHPKVVGPLYKVMTVSSSRRVPIKRSALRCSELKSMTAQAGDAIEDVCTDRGNGIGNGKKRG